MTHALREHLKLCLKWFTLPIRGGPLKGMKWIVASGGRFIRGTYEAEKTEAIQKCIQPGDIVYDVGGHVGYFSILSATLAGPKGKVFVFEPRPLNISYIRHHFSINGIDNFRLVEAAVSDRDGEAGFQIKTGTGTGHLSNKGDLKVKTITLDDFAARECVPYPNFLKIDIEGGEINALNGAKGLIDNARPNLLIAVHGSKERNFVEKFLGKIGYKFQILNPNALKGDTEILGIPDKTTA